MKKLDLLNQRFGRLVVVAPSKSKNNETMWECKCDCGKTTIVSTSNLKASRIKSCGCFKLEKLIKRSTTHNQRHTHLYEIWKSMKQRCYNPNLKPYKNWGARGIKVCDEWLNNFQSFYDWSYDNGYSIETRNNQKSKLTLDRIDVNGNYEPSNCRWVDRKTQARNTRVNKYITYKGITKCLSEWCEELNLSYSTTQGRLYRGWSIEKAFETPIKKKS